MVMRPDYIEEVEKSKSEKVNRGFVALAAMTPNCLSLAMH
jgi:hypothetical protein